MSNEDVVEMINGFAETLVNVTDRRQLRDMGSRFLASFSPESRASVAAILHQANPFFLPGWEIGAELPGTVNAKTLARFQFQATAEAHSAAQANILIACAPKSASTFIAGALARAGNLPQVSLTHNLANTQAGKDHGANNREQEIDHLALIRHGLNRRGYVAQHHTRATPFLCNLLSAFNVKTIVTYRNIFDSIVSLDDMCMEYRLAAADPEALYFLDSLPRFYHEMARDDRLRLLCAKMAFWYVNFYVGWRRCEAEGLVKPLWVSYEADFLGDRVSLAQRVCNFAGEHNFDLESLTGNLQDQAAGAGNRLNVGKAGRGADMPQDAREMVLSVARPYEKDGFDLSPLVG